MAERVVLRKGTASVRVVPEYVNEWKALGYVEDKPKRAPRKRTAGKEDEQ